jgi:predicted O-methyltransferase YrrM
MKLLRFLPSPTVYSKVFYWTAIVAVPLATFLAFSVPPLLGKLLLPSQGGAVSTWLGTMLFFQVTFLLGYGWATWLLKRRLRVQVAATVGLAVASLVFSRLASLHESQQTGIGGILFALALTTLPAMVLLFSTGPLLQGWLRRRGQPAPSRLYVFSIASGIAAVLLYPFVIERAIDLSDQIFIWRGLLWVLADLVVVAGLCLTRLDLPAPTDREAPEPISSRQVIKWLCLSALTCVGTLGATHHLAAEIGSIPLAWVGPFGIYALSFLIVFSDWWQPRFNLVCLGWLALSFTGFMFYKGVTYYTVNGPTACWLMSLTAAGSFFANGILRESRSDGRACFYLILAGGGVLGGLFACLAAPFLFLRPSEFLVMSFVLLALGLLRLIARRDMLTIAVVILIIAAPILGLVWHQTHAEAAGTLRIQRFRNTYGYKMLQSQEDGLVLRSETTSRGSQITTSAEARRRPTLYYTESTGVGRTIEETQKIRPSINVGVIGLGAGALAAYARPADRIDFWEIDPQVIRIARDFFTFVADSSGQVHIAEADGRMSLETSHTDYDVIVLDSYAGNSIPAYLLTREAMAIYLRSLEKQDGVLAIHATNRYSSLFPIVGATAHSLGWTALNVVTEIGKSTETRDWDCTLTEYVLVCHPARLRSIISWLPAEEDKGRVKRTVTAYDPVPPGSAIVWTDDRNATLDALDFRRYLTGE